MAVFTYKDIPIMYEDNHLLVVCKPANLIMQSDITNDQDLLSLLKEYLKITYNKPGNVFLALIHRLDRPVGGVCIFAKTSKAASRLSEQFRLNQVDKIYLAIICGKTNITETLIDYLIKDSQLNKSFVVDQANTNGKKAILHYRKLDYKENLSLVKITLETGRSHQIRVQFSSRNLPLWGDHRYNKNVMPKQQIALWALQLTIIHPITKEIMIFKADHPLEYPWNIFKEGICNV